MEDGLRSADANDDVRLDDLACDAQRCAALLAEVDESGTLDVVNPHVSVERPGEGGREQPVELLSARPPSEPRCDEDRLPLVGDAELAESLNDGADGRAAGVDGSARDRQSGDVRDDRGARAAADDSRQLRTGQREAQCVADGGADVRDRLGRRLGRREDDGIVRGVDDEQARAGEERDAHGSHTRLGS